MRQLKLFLILVITFVFSSIPSNAIEVINSDGVSIYYQWIMNGSKLAVIGSTKPYSGDIVIPETVTYEGKEYQVVRIENGAFKDCPITSITLPKSIVSIGEYAFSGCNNLLNIVFPDSPIDIEDYAFRGCDKFTEISLANKEMYVRYGAFSDCPNLKKINLNCNSVVAYTSNLKQYFGEQVEEYILGNDIEKIAGYAFNGCEKIRSITIPSTVTSIGEYAFYGCKQLSSISIPSKVLEIGDYCFSGCNNLTELLMYSNTIASTKSLTQIFGFQIAKCTFGEGVVSIAPNAMYGCTGLKNVVAANTLSSIGTNAFKGCNNLESVELPDKIIEFGEKPFDGCENLPYVSNSYMVIYVNPAISSYQIKETTEYIVDYAFENCSNIEKVKFPQNLKQIGNYSFYGCTGIEELSLPNSVQSLGKYAFYGCNSLKSVRLPSNLTTLDQYVFYGNSALKTIAIPNNIESISYHAFDSCIELSSIYIAKSVNSIDVSAFQNCPKLQSVHVKAERAKYSATVFENRKESTLWVPKGTRDYYLYAYGWKEFQNIKETSSDIIFKDSSVKNLCVQYWDTDGDGELSEDEAAVVTSLENIFSQNGTITSFDEFEFFTGIQTISSREFAGCVNLLSISLPKNLISIDQSAFLSCRSLESLSLPDNLESIGIGAFQNCEKIITLTIPTKVRYVGDACVAGCKSLSYISVAEDNSWYDSREGCNSIIEKDTNCLIAGSGHSTVPNSVTSIADMAFSGNCILEEILLHNGITSIGETAFDGCIKLSEISIPSNISAIQRATFSGCTSLQTAELPQQIANICEFAFYGTKLSEIEIGATIQEIGSRAFDGCNELTKVTIKRATPLSIDYDVFSNAENATLWVPYGAKSLYQANDVWRRFNAINELSQAIDLASTNVELTYEQTEFVFSGKQIKPSVTSVIVNGNKIEDVDEFYFSYGDNIQAGVGTIVVSGKDKDIYENSAIVSFEIQPKAIENVTIYTISDQTYTGEPITPAITISDGSPNTIETEDYDIEYDNNITVGTARVTLIGKRNYIGRKDISFKIVPFVVQEAEISLSTLEDNAFNGKEKKPAIAFVKIQGKTIDDTNYTVSYFNNINAGEATVLVSFINNYSGVGHVSFDILARDIALTSVLPIEDCVYSGESYEPTLSITDGSPSIISETDYYITYEDNTDSGVASVIINGQNNYKGKKTIHFNINPLVLNKEKVSVSGIPSTVEEGQEPDLSLLNITYNGKVLVKSKDYEVNINTSALTINILFKGNYSGELIYEYTVTPKPAYITFKDSKVKSICIDWWDENGDGEISVEEAASVTDIGGHFAYTGIISFEELQYFTAIKSIGNQAFKECSKLKTIILPSGIKNIGIESFEGCGTLESIVFPDNIKSIGAFAFAGCGMKELVIPDNVSQIGMGSFASCDRLTKLEIGSGVNEIGFTAFDGCNELISIISHITEPFAIDSSVFSDYNKPTLFVPAGSLEKYKSTEAWRRFIKIETETLSGIYTVDNDTDMDVTIYRLDGRKTNRLHRGVNIIQKNGITQKVYVK